MLSTKTRFPDVGSYALLAITVEGPRGGKAGTAYRSVRIMQQRADGRLLVSAAGSKKRIGHRLVDVPAIQRTVERSELRDPAFGDQVRAA